jgi:hypothetical protein
MTKVPVLAIFLAVILKAVILALWPHYQVFRARHRVPALIFESAVVLFYFVPVAAIIVIFALDGLLPH